MTHALPPLPTWLHIALWLLVLVAVLRLVWFAAHRWQPRPRQTPGRHRGDQAARLVSAQRRQQVERELWGAEQ